MKYIKKFENINQEPKVGDYVICTLDSDQVDWIHANAKKKQINFFNENIGQINVIEYADDYDDDKTVYHVYYENLPTELEEIFDNPIAFCIRQITYFSSALQVYLQDNIITNNFEYKLVDYQGNVIEDEDLFDATNKYNL